MFLNSEIQMIKRIKNASRPNDKKYKPLCKNKPGERPIVIAGFGPAGMMCAQTLALYGYKVIVLERGADADTRMKDVQLLQNEGKLNRKLTLEAVENTACNCHTRT